VESENGGGSKKEKGSGRVRWGMKRSTKKMRKKGKHRKNNKKISPFKGPGFSLEPYRSRPKRDGKNDTARLQRLEKERARETSIGELLQVKSKRLSTRKAGIAVFLRG